MKNITRYNNISWIEWCETIDKQPINNDLDFDEIIDNTINYIKNKQNGTKR
jgi:hypothetical protein